MCEMKSWSIFYRRENVDLYSYCYPQQKCHKILAVYRFGLPRERNIFLIQTRKGSCNIPSKFLINSLLYYKKKKKYSSKRSLLFEHGNIGNSSSELEFPLQVFGIDGKWHEGGANGCVAR